MIPGAIIGSIAGAGLLYAGKRYFSGRNCPSIRSMQDQVVIVTGASRGIGLETARAFAHMNCKVIFACRNKSKTDVLIEKIKQEARNPNIECIKLDLSSLASIKEFAKTFKSKYTSLNVLINNASSFSLKRMLSEDGYELQFATNHIGHFYLTNLLIDVMKKSGHGRIVNVSSGGHFQSKMKWDDINAEKEFKGLGQYLQSKLCNILFTKELQRRLDEEGADIKVLTLNPGATRTGIPSDVPCVFKALYFLLYPIVWYTSKTPRQGAQTTLYCVLESKEKIVGGGYYNECALEKSSKESNDPESWRKLWEISEEMIKSKMENPYEIL